MKRRKETRWLKRAIGKGGKSRLGFGPQLLITLPGLRTVLRQEVLIKAGANKVYFQQKKEKRRKKGKIDTGEV